MSLIFHLVDLHLLQCKPPRFTLTGWDSTAKVLCEAPHAVGFFCTHVDLRNAFWSFHLPRRFRHVFRFKHAWEGAERVFCMERMPFGSKFSPLLCHLGLQLVVEGLIPPSFYLFHYLDDFLAVGSEVRPLIEVTQAVVSALTGAGFVVSIKSTLQPVPQIFFLDKWVDLVDRSI